jgi:hypothetical protein
MNFSINAVDHEIVNSELVSGGRIGSGGFVPFKSLRIMKKISAFEFFTLPRKAVN